MFFVAAMLAVCGQTSNGTSALPYPHLTPGDTVEATATEVCTVGYTKKIRRVSASVSLIFTASHGLGPPRGPLSLQKKLAGSICCQRQPGSSQRDWLLTADDLPACEPIAEGGVVFEFACFGYGVPAHSDFAHWLPKSLGHTEKLTDVDFVSAIPQRLLANPYGPSAFIGHVDTAWLHAFADPNQPHVLDRWHARIHPFKSAVEHLLAVQPVGLALAEMNKQYDLGNATLVNYFDRMQRDMVTPTRDTLRRLTDTFIRRSDAQNYMILGDPATRLRIPAG
jgi:hypothetical protein